MKNPNLIKKFGWITFGFALLMALPFAILREGPPSFEAPIVKDDTINPFPEESRDEAVMYIQRASENYFYREFDKGIANYSKAIAIYKEREDFPHVAKTYQSLADLYVWASDTQSAEENYIQAANFHMSTDNPLGQANALLKIGEIKRKNKQYNIAQEWFQKSLLALEGAPTNRVQGNIQEAIGHSHWEADEIPQAIKAFNLAKVTYVKLNYNLGVQHMTSIVERLENGQRQQAASQPFKPSDQARIH